jgi:hypothetical protein
MIAHLALVAALVSPSPAADVTPATVEAFQRWIAAVETHEAGHVDESVRAMRALTVGDRETLDEGMGLFLAALTEKVVGTKTAAAKALTAMARAIVERGTNRFLKRAAILHADAAITSGQITNRPREDASRHGTHPSPLFPKGEMVTDTDGQFIGRTPKNWNWSFARSLLDLIAPRPDNDPFVAQWYHATTAVMLRQGLYGEAGDHLKRATIVAERDPRIFYDLACLTEFSGLPASQALLTDEDLAALRARRLPSHTPGLAIGAQASAAGIMPPEVANAEAERLFRRTLALDPGYAEARVRLARLLIERTEHAEALKQIDAALQKENDRVTSFYAHLFAGRASRGINELAAAAEHYRAALAIYPDAQSALVGASQVALLQGDSDRAMEAVRVLTAIANDPARGTDPWWHYRMGAGYKADPLWRETLAMMEAR